jgi:uncharacterized protein (TIGR02996 family)
MARKRAQPPEPPPGPQMSETERAELDARLAGMITKPNRTELFAGRFFLLWSARDDSGSAQVMVWNPETPDEIRNANYFHDAAHGLGEFAKPVQKGKPVRRTAEHQAFIAGILANREDDTGYLAYADYLTEHGDPLGDFIRLSVELDKLPPDSPEAREKNDRTGELMSAHSEEWFAPLGELGLRPEFYGTFMPWAWMSYRHGVIEEVTIDRSGILPQNAARLFAAAPFLRKVKFEQGHLDPAGLAKVKQLTQIEELDLHRTELNAVGLRALLRSKYLSGLKSLIIGGNEIGDEGTWALTEWPGLAKLESLDVTSCGMNDGGIVTLANAPGLTRLKRLRAGRNTNDPADLNLLLGSIYLKSLTELELGGTEFGTVEAGWFGHAAFTGTLTHLDLDSATFQPGAFEAFTRCKLPALQTLKLNSVAIRAPEAALLASAAFAGTLTELYLDVCGLGAAGVEALARGKYAKLTLIDLSRNRMGNRGAVALAGAAKNFPALTNLRLWDNKIGAEGVRALANSKLAANLTDLDLSGNKITPAGAMALANSKYLTKLTNLVVDEKAVGKKGKQALVARFGESAVGLR